MEKVYTGSIGKSRERFERDDKNMKIEKCKKESFTVIGKEGSTSDGEGFIQKLWDDANDSINKDNIKKEKEKMYE